MNSKTPKTKNKVNRKPKKTAAVIVAVLVALFVILAAVITILLIYKPTYQIDIPFATTDATGGIGIVVTDDEGNDIEVARNQEQVNFLILGKDRWAFNTDVMIIASYNVTDGAISMMQIPRDTYIDVGRGNHKANSLLASFYNEALRSGEKDPIAAAIKGMEETFEQVFCITIDYYAMMDLNGFVNIVDALGGVEVDVPSNMKYNDPIQGLNINLKKGLQTLDGDKAEQFIRFRADYVEGDIGRVDAQKIFISACLNKVKSNFNVSTITKIAEEVMKYVKTDITLPDLIYYAKNALSVDLNKMTMMTLPGIQGRQYDTSGTWYYIVYRDGMLAAVNKYFNSYNFEVTADMFDKNDALYDSAGSYMHSIFLTEHKGEESYNASNADDIVIHKYAYSSVTTTKTTTAEDPVVDPAQTTETGEPGVTVDSTAEITADPTDTGIHTEPEAPDVTDETGDVTEEPETTDVIEVTEEITDLEEPAETTAVPAPEETVEAPAETTVAPVETTVAPIETDAPAETTAASAETEASAITEEE